MNDKRINLLDFDRESMKRFFVEELNEKAFRADQVLKWIYHYHIYDFDKMSNLNKDLRKKLQENTEITLLTCHSYQESDDGTIKFAMDVGQKQLIETVYIPEENRATLCISSQVGCALECSFCSTAQQGFNRNLKVSEIIGQVLFVEQFIKQKKQTEEKQISNVVFMGMGEPLLNLNHVIDTIYLLLDDLGFGLSKRRVTVSTSGVVPALEKLSKKVDVALAISLHASNDQLRNELVPVNKKYNIDCFLNGVRQYLAVSNANRGKVTVEYVMMSHINDSTEQAEELASLMKNTPCKINLIPFNPFPGTNYLKSSNSRIDRFAKVLIEQGYVVTVRKTRGDDIDAACGQLAGDIRDRTKRVMKNKIRSNSIDIKIN